MELSSDEQRQLLLNLVASKERELAAHDKNKPEEKKKPDTDPAQKAQMDAISQEITQKNSQRDQLLKQSKDAEAKKRAATLRAAIADRVLSSLTNFEAQHTAFLASVANDCAELEIDPRTLVTIDVHKDFIEVISKNAKKLAEDQNAIVADLLNQQFGLKQAVQDLSNKLDASNGAFQAYVEALREWQETRDAILGTDETPDSLKYFEKKIVDLDSLPTKLSAAQQNRETKVQEIFAQISTMISAYKELYEPVQNFITNHPLAKDKFKLEFDARIIPMELNRLLEKVNQGRKGSFCGVEEGKLRLKQLSDAADFGTADGVVKFVDALFDHFQYDYRFSPKTVAVVRDQLKAGNEVVDLLNAIYDLKYLSPRYQLRWSGKDLDELSPGEKGTLLLIFYLLIDKRDIPLIIDQPEENLDNQTVYKILVPCLREARKKRQVVIVTHNPNLAIVCDADQIIHCAIDKTQKNRITYTTGAIENETLNHLIVDVLEGTRPAFDHRDAKYQEDEDALGAAHTAGTI
ncbi:MAG: hypothetical protein ROO76_07195 [Terriglobia bacterium]|nr:hypothetical protein [Terriglobia bacterium]